MPTIEMFNEVKEVLAEITAVLKPPPNQIVDVETAYTSTMHTSLKLAKMLLTISEQQQNHIDVLEKQIKSINKTLSFHNMERE